MNIIINGGPRGIGKEVAVLLANDESNKVVVTGRNKKALDQLSSDLRNLKTFQLDLSTFDSQAVKFKEFIYNDLHHVDILINMAGLLIVKDFSNISSIESRLIMETNFIGPSSVIRLMKPLMKEGSHIINISSMGGFQGSAKYRGLSYYSASKAALSCLSECLALEFIESGISVNCLALGAVETEMLEMAFPGFKAPVTAKKMAEFISDFALKGHKYMNGKVIPVSISNP
jgi:NAD(P)-dependent dehydrogenase (short-subunit alcohol dehydrogenase family)